MVQNGFRPGMALNYHELGELEAHRKRLDEAAYWYTRALSVEEELGNRPGMARGYLQLGVIAQRRDQLGEAAQLYAEALVYGMKSVIA